MGKGIIVPCITIFHEDGSIDYINMIQHTEHLIQSGVDGILLWGSLGEFYSVSMEEKKKLVQKIVQNTAKRTQIIVGISSCSMNDILELGMYCKIAGADAVMVVSPYYFAAVHDSIEEFFSKIAKNVDMPIFFYNFPDRTGNSLESNMIVCLVKKYKNFVGLKDTVDMISHTRELILKIKEVRSDFLVYSGFDEYYCSNRLAGGDGIIGGLGNIVPELMVRMHKAYEENDFMTLKLCSKKVAIFMELYVVTPLFISGVKVAVKLQGLDISCYTNFPAIEVNQKVRERVAAILQKAKAV
jgi:4-hydroxy-tetrahydrodipicolinate synthase